MMTIMNNRYTSAATFVQKPTRNAMLFSSRTGPSQTSPATMQRLAMQSTIALITVFTHPADTLALHFLFARRLEQTPHPHSTTHPKSHLNASLFPPSPSLTTHTLHHNHPTPFAYSTISSPPNLLSPYKRSTNVIGTSPTLYPIARALTIISI